MQVLPGIYGVYTEPLAKLTMHAAFATLDERLRSQFNRCLHEPAGQDGVSCLLLAVIDQLNDLEMRAHELDAAALRTRTCVWLVENRTTIVDDVWKCRASAEYSDFGLLCDFGDDYYEFLENERAVGNHVVLVAICGVLSEFFCVDFAAKVCARAPNH